jgi:hypothetical protein
MIVFHDVKEVEAVRKLLFAGPRTVRKRVSFSYLTPQRIYEYQRDTANPAQSPR